MADKVDRRVQQTPPSNDLLERFARFNLHFGRFLRDGLGIILIAAAFIALLGLLGATGGVLLTPVSGALARWLGWGSYLLAVAVGWAGIRLIVRPAEPAKWGRIIALELAGLLTLGLISLVMGNSIARADAGLDGGYVGWGIAYLTARYLGRIASFILLGLLWLLTLLTGVGAWSRLEAWLQRLAGEAPQPVAVPEVKKEEPKTEPNEEAPKAAVKKPTPKLPPEFRPSLAAPEKKNAKPAKPVLRPSLATGWVPR